MFVREALEVVRDHAYYADRIDWPAWEASGAAAASTAVETRDTYPWVRRLVSALVDGHSGFSPPDASAGAELRGLPSGAAEADSVGHLALPGVTTKPGSPAEHEYVAAAHAVLAVSACGWVLDLRANGGGNLFPMLAAVAPLLGPGTAVTYQRRDGSLISFEIGADGAVVYPDGTVVGPPPGASVGPTPGRVAVLFGQATASSGEGVVMAFRGRPESRSFGTPTRGVPTAVDGFVLADGSSLNITTAIGVDRAGVAHEDPISPDALEPNPDAAWQAAHEWVSGSAQCSPTKAS